LKIYTVNDDKEAKNILQLLKLNAECARLHWSRTINNIPTDVMVALETIEEYVESKVVELCGSPISELTEEEENKLFQLVRNNSTVKNILGTGVVLRGSQAEEVTKIIMTENGTEKLREALESGDNIVLY
jgi:uncharacterized SAM-dependent methyltransferase